ncbi:TonB-dependent receptor domain-containing protein [Crocinitomix catalasitica]|uniref:TonB-dependent receptor domain-containing protein n=1 Tax=Crocinitomix catalasitica TaxID=184607 RepID=UPI000483D368|nr:TonB-dependent receptor [Crocinitomix catalasitica]
MVRILLPIFCLILSHGFAQNVKVEGTLKADDLPYELSKMLIYKSVDSTLTKAVFLDSSYFSTEFNSEGVSDFYMTLRAPGFSDTTISFSIIDGLANLGTIELTKSTNLETVDFVYQKPTFERTMDGISVNVDGTTLAQLNNLFDVLKAAPRLTSPDDESIEIIGKGSPLILIDRQAIISNEELKAIPADQIEKIEIITNPSAKYKAQGSGSGVIEVYTKNFHLEGYNVTVSADGGINTQLKPTSRLNGGISLKKNKFSLNGYLGASYSSQISLSETEGFTTDDSQRTFDSESTDESQNLWNYYNLKAAYRPTDRQRFTVGVNGYGSLNSSNNVSDAIYAINEAKMTSESQSSDPSSTWLNNSAFANYTLETDTNNSALEINLNYNNKISQSKGNYFSDYNNFVDNSFSTFNVRNESSDRPNVGELRVNYDHNFDTTKWSLNVGGSYSILINGKKFNQFNRVGEEYIVDPLYTNSYDYQEQIGALFTELSKNWDKFGFRVGVRGEYTGLNGYSNSLDQQFIDSTYFLLFPNASLLFEPGENVALSLSYSTGIDRPQFSNFDPFVRIQDSLSVTYGNPYLRPATIQTFSLEIDLFYAYNLTLSYTHKKDQQSTLSFVDDDSFYRESTPMNADYEEVYSASLSIPIQLKWLTGWNSIWANYNQYYFTPEFGRENLGNLTYGYYGHLNFTLPKNWSIMNRLYIYKWGSSDMVSNTVLNWGMRFTKKYKGNNFQIYADISNIIPPVSKYENYSGNFQANTISQNNFTAFKLGLYYKFGRLKGSNDIQESKSKQSDRI